MTELEKKISQMNQQSDTNVYKQLYQQLNSSIENYVKELSEKDSQLASSSLQMNELEMKFNHEKSVYLESIKKLEQLNNESLLTKSDYEMEISALTTKNEVFSIDL